MSMLCKKIAQTRFEVCKILVPNFLNLLSFCYFYSDSKMKVGKFIVSKTGAACK